MIGLKKGHKLYKRLFLIIVLLLMSQALLAQSKDQKTQDPRYMLHPETGKLSMEVRIWGEVQKPGVTLVPSDADLISLLSYVGGPTGRAKLNKIRIIRFNVQEGEGRVVYANIEAFIETGDDNFMPVIYPNDTIIVNGTIWKVVNEFMPYIATGISLLQFYYTILLIGNL
jgi:hypothetical protein